ncbi:hypothetical protein [Acinetobacter nosocomialis]|uniref:hypothetical protein n=1 Tax=Acinetobacter nosocomialis TaxID=106654 RepID=UPI0024DEABB7|nr:hypothetical protein [Acinetobacter nosocomialis]
MVKLFSQSLDPKDIERLNHLLKELNSLNKSLTAKYTLRNDLVAITDGRSAAAKAIKDEIDNLRFETNALKVEKEKLFHELEALVELKNETDELKQLLQQNFRPNVRLIDHLKSFLTEETISNLNERAQKINNLYDDFYLTNFEGKHKIEKINEIYAKAEELNDFLFVDKISYEGLTVQREQVLKKEYEKIDQFYNSLFNENKDENGEIQIPISTSINQQKMKLDQFYTKIFGSDNSEQKSLSDVLDNSLLKLKNVEEEAKKIIGLSSNAGLAGGFVEKGKHAQNNKYVSLGVFCLSLIALAVFNFCTINFEELDKISLTSIVIRLVINIPLIWVATVANLNLNKYSKLEAEYGLMCAEKTGGFNLVN